MLIIKSDCAFWVDTVREIPVSVSYYIKFVRIWNEARAAKYLNAEYHVYAYHIGPKTFVIKIHVERGVEANPLNKHYTPHAVAFITPIIAAFAKAFELSVWADVLLFDLQVPK